MQQAAFWLPMHISNLSPWAVHCSVWLSCSFVYFGCFPEKESDPQKCSWILQRGNEIIWIPLEVKVRTHGHRVYFKEAASAIHAHAAGLFKKPADGDSELVAHLTLPSY